jgi:hypothetical protein
MSVLIEKLINISNSGVDVSPYIYTIPINTSRGTVFFYRNVDVTISKIHANTILNCYMIDIEWGSEGIYGIPINAGVNLTEQYPQCPISNLYATDVKNIGGEIRDYTSLRLITIDEEALYG